VANLEDLVQLERDGWDALSAGGEAATAFYGEILAREVLFLLPGDLVIDDRDEAIKSMSGAPWESFDLADERVLELGETAAAVTYRVRASRAGHEYAALITSTYARVAGSWRLVVHQQTPL
jgi:Domain of unknown function (DUF4440)